VEDWRRGVTLAASPAAITLAMLFTWRSQVDLERRALEPEKALSYLVLDQRGGHGRSPSGVSGLLVRDYKGRKPSGSSAQTREFHWNVPLWVGPVVNRQLCFVSSRAQ
jgi:hypothetical protein